MDLAGNSYTSSPASKLFYILNYNAKGNAAIFNKTLRFLGYTGAHDPGFGIIHSNEPAQGFVLSRESANILNIIDNPFIQTQTQKQNSISPDAPFDRPVKNVSTMYDVTNDLASKYLAISKLPKKDLLAFVDDKNPIIVRLLAKELDPEDLYHIVPSDDAEVNEILAARITNDEFVKKLKITTNVVINLAQNNNLSNELRNHLFQIYAKNIVAKINDDSHGNIETVIDKLKPFKNTNLVLFLNETIIRNVAKNTSTPPEILAKLSLSTDEWVILYVARNTSTPPEILAKLSLSTNKWVVENVAENTSTPPETLTKLLRHKDLKVREAARENLERRKVSVANRYYSLLSLAATIKKQASNIETISISKNDPRLLEYKDQIFDIIKQRYASQLGMFKWMLALKFIPDDFIKHLKFDKITLTIDKTNNKVLAVSGINERDFMQRVRMFAMSEGLGTKSSLETIKQHLNNVFAEKAYAELTVDLFNGLYNVVKLIKKSDPEFNQSIYIYPAYVAALMIPYRKMLVEDNGVTYQKVVHRADTVGTKIFISNVPELYGVKGAERIDEVDAKYNGQLISSNGDKIQIHEFNKDLWGKH